MEAENLHKIAKDSRLTQKFYLVGLTKNDREKHAQELIKKWTKREWAHSRTHNDLIFNSYIIFRKVTLPNSIDEKKIKFKNNFKMTAFWIGSGILGPIFMYLIPPLGWFLILFFLGAPIYLYKKKWDQSGKTGKAIMLTLTFFLSGVYIKWHGDYIKEHNKQQRLERKIAANNLTNKYKIKRDKANQIATSLKNLLINEGVSPGLIIDVKSDPVGMLVIQVSNFWLARPNYEQKQNKQILEALIKQIARPNGWNYYLVDYLGNKI